MSSITSFNRLKHEQSAYLREHAEHPIHWWPYGPEALQRAHDEDRPIFLSIGYSSCHWCHTMARECFENPEIASFLNDHFVCVKVDREEHPDIDAYYQKAALAFQRGGGWPLTVFCMPDMKPFFIGTYFPAISKHGLPSFLDVIKEVARTYESDRESVSKHAADASSKTEAKQLLTQKVEFEGHYPPPAAILNVLKQFQNAEHGGYGQAPRFPNYAFFEWAVEHIGEGMVPEEQAKHIFASIEQMCMGAIFDHAKGGMHRYATDEAWRIPHFEKMLYDQAGLLRLLAKTTLVYPSPVLLDALVQTLDYLETEMLSEQKYFMSAQDSESEEQEGLYFGFTQQEFDDAITQSADEGLIQHKEQLRNWFGITEKGNLEHHLNTIGLFPKDRDTLFTPANWDMVRRTRTALLADRRNRIPPMTDTKGIASWNWLVVSALCDVIQYTRIDIIRANASRLLNQALEGIYKAFVIPNGGENEKTHIRHSTTRDSFPLLEDYVFFAEAQLRIYEITGTPIFKQNAKEALDFLMHEFIFEGRLTTRSTLFDDLADYANIEIPMHDQSFRSPAAALIGLVRRMSVLEGTTAYLEKLAEIIDFATHISLQSPLAHGEAMRALTYPAEVYRKIRVPRKWVAENPAFLRFIPHFPTRFVLDYHSDANEEWDICSMKECELKGIGIDEFSKVFVPDEKSDGAPSEG